MKLLSNLIPILVSSILLSSCTSMVKYETNPTNPESPPDGAFAFALTTSSITLTPNFPLSSSENGSGKGNNGPIDVCTKSIWRSLKDDQASCAQAITVVVSPESDHKYVYIAIPASPWYQFKSETLKPTSATSDPLVLTSIQVNSNSNIPAIIGSTGAGAAAGIAFGPVGAFVGGAFGLATSFIYISGTVEEQNVKIFHQKTTRLPWYAAVCGYKNNQIKYKEMYGSFEFDEETFEKDEAAKEKDAKEKADKEKVVASLYLPVSIKYNAPENNPTNCWSPLPSPKKTTGWFYRFKSDKHKSGDDPHDTQFLPVVHDPLSLPQNKNILPAVDNNTQSGFFHLEGNSTATQKLTFFPVSACRAVKLEITWWVSLDESQKKGTEPNVIKFRINVADPQFVEEIEVPNNGTINFLSPCGGYESPGLPSPDLTNIFNTVITQVQNIRNAQLNWEKNKAAKLN